MIGLAKRTLIGEAEKKPVLTQEELQSSIAERVLQNITHTNLQSGLFCNSNKKKTILERKNNNFEMSDLQFATSHLGDTVIKLKKVL